MKTDNLLEKLTIVIPTYGRSAYALRNMNYWSGRGPRVIVLDGSPDPIAQGSTAHFSENITYIHHPVSLVQRISIVRDLVKTPYVSLLGDDEFHLASGLSASIEQLEKDLSLVACMGRALGFRVGKDNVVNGIPVYPRHESYEVLGGNSASRMLDHMERYAASTIYSVVRTDVWKDSFEAVIKKEFPVYAIGELQFELSVSYFGKSRVIPVLHWLRSFETCSVQDSADPGLDRKNIFHEWWSSIEKVEFRKEFLEITSEALAKIDGRDPGTVKGEIERAMNVYAQRCRDETKKTGFRSVIIRIKMYIKEKFPAPLIVLARAGLHSFRTLCGKNAQAIPLVSAAINLEQSGVVVDFNELEEIEKTVRAFHYRNSNIA